MSRSASIVRWVLITLHVALGLSAVVAGIALAREPSGASLTFDVEWLEGSPFDDYMIPGLFLALVIGTSNLVSALGQWRLRPSAPFVSLATGVLLIAWIVIQTWIIGYRDWTQAGWIVIFSVVTALGACQVFGRRRGG